MISDVLQGLETVHRAYADDLKLLRESLEQGLNIIQFTRTYGTRQAQYFRDVKEANEKLAARAQSLSDAYRLPEFGDTAPRLQS